MEDKFYTIAEQSEGYFTDRKSKFYSFAYPVENEEQVKSKLKDLHKKFYDARHIVYAFVIGPEGSVARASDAGEPAGSSGPPVLRAIQSKGLTNIMVAVVRYFGGKKLGIPGLINAYQQAAIDALENAKIIEKIISQQVEVNCNYNQISTVMSLLQQFGANIDSQDYGTGCKIIASIPQSKVQTFIDQLKQKAWDINVKKLDN